MATHTKQIFHDFLCTGPLIISWYAIHETLVKFMTQVYSTLKNVVYQGLFRQHMTPQNKIKFVQPEKKLSIRDC